MCADLIADVVDDESATVLSLQRPQPADPFHPIHQADEGGGARIRPQHPLMSRDYELNVVSFPSHQAFRVKGLWLHQANYQD